MWEQIASNRRRSVVFVSALFAVLVAMGGLIGAAVDPAGWPIGVGAALVLWGILYLIAAFAGDRVVLATAGAKKIEKADAPQLFNVVEEMAIASGQRVPDIYLIPDESPNAFAAGRSEKKRVVAVTSGLLRIATRDELQGVIAHEMGHHKNADVRFMILAGVMLGTIILLAELFLRSGLGRGRRSSSRKDGGAQAVILIITLLFAILAPLLARMLYLACSRRREYLADASAARFTRYPEGLASALEKISGHYTSRRDTSRVLAPLYIINPMEALAAMGLFSTHPPVQKRVEILRSMGGGAGFAAYEEASRRVLGKSLIGKRSLAADSAVDVRPPDTRPDTRDQKIERAKQAADLVGRLAHMVALNCACGVTIRIPDGLNRAAIPCPRCGADNKVPTAADRFQRQGTGWQSFRCACGKSVHLSPAFSGTHATCEACKRQIEIV
ncbi:MAG TPA: M48 family metallopeptidase [Planctomycetota bacterium]